MNVFLGGRYDERRMLAAVDGTLYRNRKEQLPGNPGAGAASA